MFSDDKIKCPKIIIIESENQLDINKCAAQMVSLLWVIASPVFSVQTRIQLIVPQKIYIYCYAYHLNLCLVHTLNSISAISEFFQIVQVIYQVYYE